MHKLANLLTYKTQEGQIIEVGVKAKNVPIENAQRKFVSLHAEGALHELHDLMMNIKNGLPSGGGSEGGLTKEQIEIDFVTKTLFNDVIQDINAGDSINDYSAMRIFNAASYKNSGNTWTDALNAAFYAAGRAFEATNGVYTSISGSKLWLSGYTKVIMPIGLYVIEGQIDVPFGVNFDFTGCMWLSADTTNMVNYDALNAVGKAYHNVYKLPWFVGFRRCFVYSTTNRDTCIIDVSGGGAYNCKVFIDDVGYLAVRSTQEHIHDFCTVLTDQAVRTHADNTHIHDYWVSSSGYNGPAFLSQARLTAEHGVLVPKPMQSSSGNKACWFAQYTQTANGELVNHGTGLSEGMEVGDAKPGEVGHNNRALVLKHSTFGGETGSMPAVRWYGRTATNLNNSNALHNLLALEDLSVEAGNTSQIPEKSIIVIENDLPPMIDLRNLNGMSAASHGVIYVKPTASRLHTQADQKWKYNINVDKVNGRPSYPFTNDPSIMQFITVPVPLNKTVNTLSDLRLPRTLGDGGQPTTPPDTTNKGTVMFTTHGNATITLAGQTKTANASGEATFSGIDYGTYTYNVSLSGYTSKSGTVNVDRSSQGINVVLSKTSPDPDVPIEDREPIRYIRLGGNQPDGDFKIGEIEVWQNGNNILAGRQDWTVPSGTTRNILPPPTDGVRGYNNLTSINNTTDRSKQYIEFDLKNDYKDIERVNFLLYPTLTFNVFLQVSSDGTNWKTVYSNLNLTQTDMTGTDISATLLYD